MKQSAFKKLALVAGLVVALQAVPAFSARVLNTVISGTVSSVSGDQIVVNGTTYNVQQSGSTLSQLQLVQPGETVDLVLNGPAGGTNTQVVGIHVHPAS